VRLARVRFTIKRMMLAVAVLSLIMGGSRMAWLSVRYHRAARYYATLERFFRQVQRLAQDNAASPDELALLMGSNPLIENKLARAAAAMTFQHTGDYYAALRRKYERAAVCPWFPVGEDPCPLLR
jgi:hypothetical protein